MNIRQKVIWVYFISYLSGVLAYLLRILYTKELSLHDVGLIWSIVGFVGVFSILNDMGFSETLNYFATRFYQKKQFGKVKAALAYSFFFQLGTSLLVFAVLFSLSSYLAQNYFDSPLAANILIYFLLYMMFFNLSGCFVNLFTALHQYYYYSLVDVIRLVVVLCVSAASFYWYDKSLAIIGWGWFLGHFIVLIVAYTHARIKYPQIFNAKAAYSSKLFKEMWSYAIPILAGTGAVLLLARLDIVLLTWLSTLENVAVYSNIYSLSQIIMLALGPVSTLFFPLYSKLAVLKDFKTMRNLWDKFYTVGVLVTLPFLLLFVSFPKEIILFFYGEQYLVGYASLIVLSVAAYIYFLTLLPLGVIAGTGNVKKRTLGLYVCAAVNLFLGIILIPLFGIIGVAIAMLVSNTFLFIYSLSFSLSYLNHNFFRKHLSYYGKLFFINGLYLLSVLILKNIITLPIIPKGIIIGISSVLIYVMLVLCLKLFSVEQILFEIKKIVEKD